MYILQLTLMFMIGISLRDTQTTHQEANNIRFDRVITSKDIITLCVNYYAKHHPYPHHGTKANIVQILLSGTIEVNPGPKRTGHENISTNMNLKGIKIIHQNCRGLFNNMANLTALFSGQKNTILTLSETHIESNSAHDVDDLYQIPGFQFIKRNRTTGKGGGVAVYISNNIKWKRKNNFENSNIESVWIEITPNKSKSFFVGCVYRPPDSSCHLSKEWNNIFSLDLANIFDCEKETIVVGDFNVNYLKRADHREVKDIFNGHGLTQLIKDPTRVTSSSSTLIDLIFTNKPCNISKSTVLPLSLSDHDAILCVRKLKNSKTQQKEVSSRNYRNYDENAFGNHLRQSDWDYFYSCTDVNKAWESFKNIFLTTLNHPLLQKESKGDPVHGSQPT